MSLLRPAIRDDAGRRVPLAPLKTAGRTTGDDPRSMRFRRAARTPGPKPTRREWARGIGWGVAVLPLLLATALLPAWLTFSLRLPWWGVLLGALPMGLCPAGLTIFLARRVSAERIARLYRLAGYCASCGYDLCEIPEGEGGRRLCPECAAEWRIERTNAKPEAEPKAPD